MIYYINLYKEWSSNFIKGIFITRLTERGGYHPSLDFFYKGSESYDFGTR